MKKNLAQALAAVDLDDRPLPGGPALPPERPRAVDNPGEEPPPKPFVPPTKTTSDVKRIVELVDMAVDACRVLEAVYEEASKMPIGERTIEGLLAHKPLRMIGGLVRRRLGVGRNWSRFKREFVLPLSGWNPQR